MVNQRVGPRAHDPLRVAFLSYRGARHVGGQGVYTRHLTKVLTDLGHHVEVLGGQPYPDLDARVALTKLPSLDIFNDHFPGRAPAFWELHTLADHVESAQFRTGTFSEPLAFTLRAHRHLSPRRAEFDLVHDNQSLGYGLLSIDKYLPTIATLHHPISKDRDLEVAQAEGRRARWSKRRWYGFVEMQSRVARRLDRVMVVSENSIDDFHHDFGIDRARMHLVHVGVDAQLFAPRPDVARQPGRLITTASSDVALKGLAVLLEAVAKLRTERSIRLTVIGRARAGGPTMAAIERLGIADIVEFVSGISDDAVVEHYANSELAVVPSLYEGFSLPAVEAMATGTALVATTGGALPEVTGTDGDTVLACPPGDAGSLAAAITRGLDDPELRARIGAAGRQRVVSRWTWRRTGERTVQQYRELLEERTAAC
jgi:glycosyltransferase involved in cell wall biosynthesis